VAERGGRQSTVGACQDDDDAAGADVAGGQLGQQLGQLGPFQVGLSRRRRRVNGRDPRIWRRRRGNIV